MLTIIAVNSTLSEQCPEICQKCQEIGHFLPGAFPPRHVLPKKPCALANFGTDLYIQH